MACYEYNGIKYKEEELRNLLSPKPTKTRRILEVQSDLFQKGRDKEMLTSERITPVNRFEFNGDIYYYKGDEYFKNDKSITRDEYHEAKFEVRGKGKPDNQFLQLLNKDNNWVTFFVKAVLQDSAKKGYEKVLFPTGNTASKVEGHSTLEEFKKQKEDRIKELEKEQVKLNSNLEQGVYGMDTADYDLRSDKILEEIDTLEKELERVEREGFGALRPIYNFYENTVTNILKKQGYNPTLITDEYGNTWQEIQIKESYKNNILLQKPNSTKPNNQQTIQLSKELLERMGVDYKKVKDIVVNGVKLDANGVADITKGVIQVIEGKESEALPEEVMHFAVEIIEQKNPKLFNKMLTEIGDFPIYKQVLSDYSNDSNYQINGKPDIRKLKKEAIAKQLVDTIINKVESSNYSQIAKTQNWWSEILQFIKNLFGQSGFDQAAMDIISGKEIGTIEDIRNKSKTTSEQLYLQQEAKKYAAQEIAEQFKSKEKPNERKFNKPTNLPEGFRVLQRTGINQYSTLLSSGGNTGDLREVQSRSPQSLSYYEGVFGRNFKSIFSVQNGGSVVERRKQRYGNLRVIQSLLENKLFRELASRLKLEEIRIVKNDNDVPDRSLFIKPGESILYINEDELLTNLQEKFNRGINLDEYIDLAVFEEMIHIIATKIHTKSELDQAAIEFISQDSEQLIDKFYQDVNPQQSILFKSQPYNIINELIRMKVQKDLAGKSTEDIANKSFIDNVVTKIWDFIMGLFKNNLVKTSKIAENVKNYILEKEDFDINNVDSNEILGLPPLNIQDNIINKFKNIASQVEKKGEEGYFINGVKVNRVTDIIKNWLDRRFDERKITNSEYDNALDDLKAETGTKYHNYIEKAGEVFVDQDGNLREIPLEDQEYVDSLPVIEAEKYLLLKENLKQRLDSFEPGTKFLFEQIVYDSNRKLAGTIDFIAITPNGEVSILDWKFMSLNTQTYKDVPWYKTDAWNRQMEQYKLIVSKVYGVKNEDFKQTRMIPFRVDYVGGDRRKDILPSPQSIEIGNVNVQDIEEDYLLPVPLRGETTGDKTLDSLLEKLNSVYDSLSQKKVTEADKKAKAEQLNSLFGAIRQLQVKKNLIPLIQQAKILNKGINDILKEYSTKFEGKDPRSFTEDKINDFAHDINVFQEAIENYIELDTELDYLFENKELDEFDKLVKQELEETVKTARKIKIKLSNIDKEFADKFVAGYEQVQGSILNPEKIVQWLPKMFSSTSTLQIKTIEIFFKKINRALFFAQKDAITETEQLLDLQKNYEKWATSKNISKKNYFDILKKKDKNELIDQYQKEFYKELKDKIKDKDITWIRNNIDKEAYQKYLDEELKKELKRIEDKPRFGSESDIDTQKSIEKAKAKREYSIDNIDSLGLLRYSDVKKFPVSKWETKEWKELNKPENKAALDFYNYIIERNEYYASLGYIQGGYARKFLPFVRKGIIEKLITNPQGIRLGEDFLRSISIDGGDIGYGKIDPITGETIKSIPKYFTREIEGELSNDLFRTMALYNEAALKYEYLSKIEDSVRSLQRIEKNKKSILTSKWGKSQYKDGQIQYNPNNTQNSEILDSMVNAILYGQKYPENEGFDLLMGKIGGFGKTINDKLGIKVFPEQFEGKQVSMTKMIDQLNNTFQLTALGLNPLPSISNFFGGNFQSVINAGKYFTKTDFIAAELGLLANKLTGGEDQKKLIGALSYFLPLTENYNQHIAKQLSLNTLSQENIQEFLMVLMRKSDWVVQTASFYAYLKNSAVVDGKVVNTREYLRNQPEFKDSFYKGTSEQRKEIRAKFEEAVKKLNEEKGVLKLAEIKDNKFVIPGLDNKDISVVELRRNVQQLAKDALGNLSSDDLRKINLTIYGKSFMVFKNWIPRLVDVRMGNLKFNSSSDAYEWGRTRLVFRLLTQDTLKTLKSLKGALTGNGDLFISQIKELYEKKKAEYEADTGKTLNMSEDMFIDLVQKNVKNQLLDTIFMLSLLGLFYGLKAAAPEDDEDPAVKNSYRFMVKAVDKIKDELAYFYNPTSITSMVSSGVFPAVSWITNAEKLISNFGKETFAISTGNTELEEDTYVIKYLMKSFPISNQASQLLPIFYEDLAKDLGIKMSTEARAGAR